MMLSSVPNYAETACRFLLQYTPFVPAIQQINQKWVINESLLTKRAYVIRTIAVAVFAASIACEATVIAILSVGLFYLLFTKDDSCRWFLTGGIAAEKWIFHHQFEIPLNKSETYIEDLDLSILTKNHALLSNEKIKTIHNKLTTKQSKSNPQKNWIDVWMENESFLMADAYYLIEYLKKLNELKLLNKSIYVDLLKKINASFDLYPSFLNKNTFLLQQLIEIDGFSVPPEEETLLFSSSESIAPILVIKSHLKNTKGHTPTFVAQHFAYIVKKYPNDARRIVGMLAFWSNNNNIDTDNWMNLFDQHNPGHPLREQFKATLNFYTNPSIQRTFLISSQKQAQNWLDNQSNTSDPKYQINKDRAQFADAFQEADPT